MGRDNATYKQIALYADCLSHFRQFTLTCLMLSWLIYNKRRKWSTNAIGWNCPGRRIMLFSIHISAINLISFVRSEGYFCFGKRRNYGKKFQWRCTFGFVPGIWMTPIRVHVFIQYCSWYSPWQKESIVVPWLEKTCYILAKSWY